MAAEVAPESKLEQALRALESINTLLAQAEIPDAALLAGILAERARAVARVERIVRAGFRGGAGDLLRLRRVHEQGERTAAALRALRRELTEEWTRVARDNHVLHRILADGHNLEDPLAVDIKA